MSVAAETSDQVSFEQQRLWLLNRLMPLSSVYNVGYTLQLLGYINIQALAQAIEELVSRHEILRTRYDSSNGAPVQLIAPTGGVVLQVDDLTWLPAEQRELEARKLAEREHSTGFDLQHGPLLRTKLLRIDEDEHWLLLTLHHIVTDGWSMGVMWNELSVLYEAFLRGEASPLPPLSIQYADYAVWQRDWLSGERLQRELGYWREALVQMPALELPTDRMRPAASSYRGGRVAFELSEQLTGELKGLARREGATLFMVLLAGVQVLLSRYSGQEDFGVGIPIAGRTRPELEGLIGFFVNTLVLRARLQGQPSFKEYLARVREAALGAYEHPELPFEKLVEELNPPRDLSRNPLFQVMFALQNAPDALPQLQGLQVHRVEGIDDETAKFDLSLSLTEAKGGLSGSIEYATDLFDRDRIERMAGHYRVLLEAAVANPECSVAHLPLLTEAERRQLLVQWNDTAREYPRDRCVHQLVEEQVQRSPEAIAVVFGAQRLTYAQLNARANQLAHHLRGLGVGPEVLVGLCVERSVELVVGMLGILKAGGAYVPLDPSYPAQRLGFMLQDAAAPVLLTQQRLLGQLPAYTGQVICLDRDWGEIARQPGTTPAHQTRPENLAYVIYTSGSTGTPKGVMIEHRSIIRLVCSADYVRLGPEDVVAQASNASFDAATFEVWGAWVNGARLVVIPKETLLGAQSLAQAIAAHGVTTMFVTTALFNRLAQESPLPLANLRTLLFGGEASDAQAVARVLQSPSRPRRIVHVYGPTETTTFATWLEVNSVEDGARQIPIGRAIANTSAYVLDRQGQLQPVGVAGDLHIGGPGVARGYLGHPELTAERFVTDELSARTGARLYRTGDRVRWRRDGLLEFLGRFDEQVKIRGYRIEPREIEAVLATHSAVANCVVDRRETLPGEKALVAYVVAKPGLSLERDAVRGFLAGKLPNFMIPAAVIALPELPLTPNGKIDRARLPAPRMTEEASREGRARPSDQLELHLLKLWERVLGVDGLGPRDDFFALGGHSLLAAQLIDEIERQMGRRLPLDTLWYRGATVADFARLLRQDERSASWPMLVPLRAGGSPPALFCVHTQGGNLFHYDALARAMAPHQAVLGLQARGVYGKEQPRQTIEDIAVDCVRAMRETQPRGPYSIAGYSSGGVVAFEMAKQLEEAGEEIGLLALLDCFSPKVLRVAPLARVRRWLLPSERRHLQERAYHAVLHTLRLSGLRKLRKIGEAHRWAHWSYRPTPIRGRIVLFAAEESLRLTRDEALGWADLAVGGIEVRRFSGSHSSMMKPPLVHELADALQALVDASCGPSVTTRRVDAVLNPAEPMI